MRLGRLALGAIRLFLALLDAVISPPLSKLDEAERRRAEKRRREALEAANRVGRR